MESVAIKSVLDKLPSAQLDKTLSDFVAPFTAVLPDARLRQVVPLAVRGIVAGETPVITSMMRTVARTEDTPWAAAKRLYRFLENPRLSASKLAEGLYQCARAIVAGEGETAGAPGRRTRPGELREALHSQARRG